MSDDPGKLQAEHNVESNVENEAGPIAPREPLSGWRRILNLALAAFFFFAACCGLLLPGLPTTPFLLLTSALLVRSSPRLNQRLLRSRLFGPILTDWQQHGGIRPHVRVKSIALVTVVVALSFYCLRPSGWIAWTILTGTTVGLLVILRLPAARPPGSST